MVIFLFNFISAFDISLQKTQYYPGETMQLEISDIFTTNLQDSNLGIYLAGSNHKTPVNSGLFKSTGKYYLYFILPAIPGNYSLNLENIAHIENSVQSTATITHNFSIVATNDSYLSFNPGYIQTSQDFSITIKAYGSSQKVNIDFAPTNLKQNITINPGIEKTIYFSIADISDFTESEIKINSYKIPVTISPKNQVKPNLTIEPLSIEDQIEVVPKNISAIILKNQDYYFTISIFNQINSTINNLSIYSDNSAIKIINQNLSLGLEKIDLDIILKTDKDLSGNIFISLGNESLEIPVSIKITTNSSNVTSNIQPVNLKKTCKDLNGIKCDSTKAESCNGIQTTASDGVCCLADCEVAKTSGSWIWALVILVFIGLGVWFLYKKSKNSGGDERANEIIRRRAQDYEKKIEPEEVRKNLSKD